MRQLVRAIMAVAAIAAVQAPGPRLFAQEGAGPVGLQEPAWAPDGRRIAVSYLDRIWTMAPDGRQARALVEGDEPRVEREPAWSPDGTRVAFAADRGDGFDILVAPSRGGAAVAATAMPGDERWPSWTPDGRLVFSHRAPRPDGQRTAPGQTWDVYLAAPVTGSTGWQTPVALSDTDATSETFPRVSPDGARVVFVSDRDNDDDVDLWVMPVPPASETAPVPLGARAPGRDAGNDAAGEKPKRPTARRVARAAGAEAYPSWAPDNTRVAYYAVRQGVGSVWVATIEAERSEEDDVPAARPKPAAPPQLVSRAGGAPAWSPDGRSLLVTGLRDPEPVYNGNPLRSDAEPPPLFATNAAFHLWRLPAPLPVHEDGGIVDAAVEPSPALFSATFDRVWQTLSDLYYGAASQAGAWTALRDKYRPRAAAARSPDALETVIDQLVAEQPLIKPVVTSNGAVVVSGHPLASEAGRLAFEKGGNVVDAMIAVSFALGVVEPEASGIGGDGSAVLYLKGMARPTVVDYKDMTPTHATMDNPLMVRDGRIVADGPAAANIPGVVAGLDYLYTHYGSGKVRWEDLVAPAITLADEGFILNESLPTTIAEGRHFLEKYPEAATIYLPGGEVPRPGDRFFNKDYANTLRAIQTGGADAFYRGEIARKIAADMEAHGGILTFADLAQYRAMEREPIKGHYRGHALYASGPPVPTGIQMFESLQVLENYTPAADLSLSGDPDYLHYLIESWKVRDQVRRVADPERWPVDFAGHLTDAHAREMFAKIDQGTASLLERPETEPPLVPRAPEPRIGTGTTSFAVADAEGNMIAVTQTLSTWGGTFYVSKGLGFLYNNHLRSNRTQEGAYGSILPLQRSSTSSVPTLVFEQTPAGEVPRLAVGCAGNAWIPVSVYRIITGVIDGRLGAQAAIEAPRFLPGRDPADPEDSAARIEIEDRFPKAAVDDLVARGHHLQKIGRKGEVRYGYAAAITVDVANHSVEGGAEPRRSHAAVPYPKQ